MDNQKIQKLVDDDEDLRKLLEAHLGKPQKVELFYNIIKNKTVDGKFKKSAFSWWGFLGGAFYFFYRKIYLYAFIIIGAGILSEIFSIGSSAINGAIGIACAMSAIPSYVQKFFKDAIKSGYGDDSIANVEDKMKKFGGYNNWAIYLCIVLTIFALIGIFFVE